jgi:serine/threonine protein kinase
MRDLRGAGGTVIGSRIGRYRIEEELGRGDFGVTWRAVDAAGASPAVALKFAHPELCRGDRFVALLQRETAGLSELEHPGIAAFHGLFGEGEQIVASRALVQGEDLRRVLVRGRVPVDHVSGLLELALRALGHAHQRRLIHGDVSPTNLFWCYDGSLRVTDFGLARAVHVARASQGGSFSGHPDYNAPELYQGQLSARSDLYALGLIAFECLVGRPACEPGDHEVKQHWHRYKGMPDPREECPDCPDWLARVLLQLAAIDPATRPADAQAALGLLRPVAAPRVGAAGSGDGASTEIGTASSGLQPPPPPEREPPAPPTIKRPPLENTVSTTVPEGFGGPAFGAADEGGFGRTLDPAPPIASSSPNAAGAAAAAASPSAPSPLVPPPERSPVSASQRGVDRRSEPRSDDERRERLRRERLKVAVFWSVTIGVLLVATVAFVGYRAMEARRLAAARASGPDIDPELLVGGGYDRFAETETEPEVHRGGARTLGDDDAADVGAQDANQARVDGAATDADERYLLGGDDQVRNELGTLSLTSNPIGARVWLNNEEIGYTPLEGFAIREGRHTVRLELEGYAWASRGVDVERGVAVDLGSVPLEREVVAAGPVLLWSVELEGASVFVDGEHAGRMPVVVDLTPGKHTFFVQPLAGEPVELELTAYPGTDEDPGRLQLESQR